MTKNIEITKEIQAKIEDMVYMNNGRRCIKLGNCRLDFSKEYILLGFTKKTVKLGWINGTDLIVCQGRVADRGDHLAFFTEGWSFIEHLKGGIAQ